MAHNVYQRLNKFQKKIDVNNFLKIPDFISEII